jgi:transcription initiation factor TFIIF subunit beta
MQSNLFIVIVLLSQVYLKEILNEFCNYNIKNPHRNMWELKPEYRCYKEEEKLAESTSKKGNESEDD